MATCRGCGDTFDWGFCDGRWVPLEPVETHDDLDRTYVDEDGELRADHRDRHSGGRSVNVARLDRKVRAEEVETEAPLHKRIALAAKTVRGRG
jgi:hypothetical protein